MRRKVHEDGGLERVWRTQEHHFGEKLDLEAMYGLKKLRRLTT